jgi:NADP-dependent 3-hydroxy acid dehydrogenase YdfG
MSGQEIAVVVGATGAMGQVIAGRLAARGLKVLAVARNAESVSALCASMPGIVPCVCDIASDAAQDAIRAAVDRPVRAIVHGPGVATSARMACSTRRPPRWSMR